jgi:Transposase IS66 family
VNARHSNALCCWSHWRREFFDIDKGVAPAPVAREALERIAASRAGLASCSYTA